MNYFSVHTSRKRLSILDLGSGMGQTDRQTDERTDNGHQRIMLHPMGAGHNKHETARVNACNMVNIYGLSSGFFSRILMHP